MGKVFFLLFSHRLRGEILLIDLCIQVLEIKLSLNCRLHGPFLKKTWYEKKSFIFQTSVHMREKLLMDSYWRIEKKLTLLGATGIEDKLQVEYK